MKSSEKYRYNVFEESFTLPELGPYRTYGIKLTSSSGKIKYISDISTDKSNVDDIAANFNKYQLSPIHFGEAVDDAIALLEYCK